MLKRVFSSKLGCTFSIVIQIKAASGGAIAASSSCPTDNEFSAQPEPGTRRRAVLSKGLPGTRGRNSVGVELAEILGYERFTAVRGIESRAPAMGLSSAAEIAAGKNTRR